MHASTSARTHHARQGQARLAHRLHHHLHRRLIRREQRGPQLAVRQRRCSCRRRCRQAPTGCAGPCACSGNCVAHGRGTRRGRGAWRSTDRWAGCLEVPWCKGLVSARPGAERGRASRCLRHAAPLRLALLLISEPSLHARPCPAAVLRPPPARARIARGGHCRTVEEGVQRRGLHAQGGAAGPAVAQA